MYVWIAGIILCSSCYKLSHKILEYEKKIGIQYHKHVAAMLISINLKRANQLYRNC